MKRTFIGALIALALASGPSLAEYPEKDINGIIQWGAGGSMDLVSRSVTPHAEKALGTSVVMQNMTGGVGVIGMKYVLAQPADGYTLLMGAENPQLYKVMGLAQQDYADFEPIILLARGVPVIAVRADAPFNTFTEMVEYIQANPDTVKFGSTGPGGLPSVVTAMLTSEVELPVTVVPYDGDGPALTALQSGAIDVMPAVLGAAIENVKAGRMKVIALVDETAHPLLPDVKPITEEYPGFERYLPWGPFFGVYAKNGTPPEVLDKLRTAYAEGAKAEQYVKLLDDRGFAPLNLQGDEARAYLDNWQRVTSWLAFDGGLAKNSPEEFGIARPE